MTDIDQFVANDLTDEELLDYVPYQAEHGMGPIHRSHMMRFFELANDAGAANHIKYGNAEWFRPDAAEMRAVAALAKMSRATKRRGAGTALPMLRAMRDYFYQMEELHARRANDAEYPDNSIAEDAKREAFEHAKAMADAYIEDLHKAQS